MMYDAGNNAKMKNNINPIYGHIRKKSINIDASGATINALSVRFDIFSSALHT